jgi:hypothetical protein
MIVGEGLKEGMSYTAVLQNIDIMQALSDDIRLIYGAGKRVLTCDHEVTLRATEHVGIQESL